MSLLNNRYEKIVKIGEGSFGRVFLASDRKAKTESLNEKEENKESNEKKQELFVALKKLKSSVPIPYLLILNIKQKKEKLKDKMNEITEIQYLMQLSHENIIKMHEAFFDKDAIFLVLDFICYDLERLLMTFHKKLNLEDIQIILSQIFRGVLFLHENNLIHRDLKSSNMLIDGNGNVKISDFSLIRKVPEESVLMTKNVVTRFYRPPEIIFGAQHYGKSVDIWSLGCIMAECFLGSYLFQGGTDIEQLSQIFQLIGPPNEETWPGCTNLPYFIGFEIKDQKSIKTRIPNLTPEAFDLLSKMLVLDPTKRISIGEVLNHPFFSKVGDLKNSNYVKIMGQIEKDELAKMLSKRKK